jgi:succinoglycan biosynthesis transport protein ExoP
MTQENKNEDNIETSSLKDYIHLVRNNLFPILIIVVVSLIISIVYAVNARNIYKSTVALKVAKPQGNILNSPIVPEFQDFGSDRFIANEIEILKTFNTRERVAEALVDSFMSLGVKDSFYLLLDQEYNEKGSAKLLSVSDIAEELADAISIDQKRGLDIIEVIVESPSPYEAALIANCYSNEYKNLNLEVNRNQLTLVKNFLLGQKEEMQSQLSVAEETLRKFQEKGGIVALDEQANNLIAQLSSFEAQENAAKIELMASNKVLAQYRNELDKQNPRLADYLKSLSSEAYFKSLQEQLVKLEVNRDLALSGKNELENSETIKEIEKKILELKNKLNDRVEEIKGGIFASSPEEVKELSQKIIEEEIKNQSLKISVDELKTIVKNYEREFNKLPKTAIELARYQRNRESLEKLYTLVEEKYQEALINEQSQPGNVLIIDNARRPIRPSKPNRILIVIVGFVLGTGLAFGYVIAKNYFDNTVKTPEDLQKRNISVLAWIPQFAEATKNGMPGYEFIVAKRPDSMASEAFRALRTRMQLLRFDKDLKTFLVTSSAPQEGKTLIAINLAGSFAQAGKKTLIVDCDLRKPRVQELFKVKRIPGLIDYLFGHISLDEVTHKGEINNLDYITCGTIPPNPAEMLESEPMREFLTNMREKYDVLILDSPPIIAVTDSEILATMVDGTILVVSADTTEFDLMEKSVEMMKKDKSSFLGTVLNNFSYKSGYGSYYKYYYYYSENSEKRTPKSTKQKL